MCAKKKRRKRRNRKIAGLNTSDMLVQAAGVGGAATASGSDAVFLKFKYFQNNQSKLGLGKGALGWAIANNPLDMDFLDNPYIQEAGKGMMYYGWGQYAGSQLGIKEKIDAAVKGIGSQQQALPADLAALVAGTGTPVDYYSEMAADKVVQTNASALAA